MANEPDKIIYSMIGVSKFYDKKPILKNINLSYFYGAKIGVLGLNGSGKSSLLRILAGVDRDFEGRTSISPGLTVGMLEQEPVLAPDKTVREVVEEAVQSTVDLLAEFNRINEKFAEPMSDEEMNDLITRQGEVQEKLDALEAWELDSKLEMAMDALRCPAGDTRISVLSGDLTLQADDDLTFGAASLIQSASGNVLLLDVFRMDRGMHGLVHRLPAAERPFVGLPASNPQSVVQFILAERQH